MRDSKSLFLLVFALVLITVCFVLISVWGYHFYFQGKEGQSAGKSAEKNLLVTEKAATLDSLQHLRDSTIRRPGDQKDTIGLTDRDSLDKTLEIKLLEYNRLKEEITEILKNKTSSQDTGLAREKIGALQQSIDELRSQNNQVARENARLNKILRRFIISNNPKGMALDEAHPARGNLGGSAALLPLLVSHLRFTALAGERETKMASAAEKLEGSFQITINTAKNSSPDIYVVILQPNGRVLLNSSWESGTFETPSGRSIYSAVLHFENKDNNNRLHFSISSSRLQQGVYTLQIFHEGVLIGRLTKRLS